MTETSTTSKAIQLANTPEGDYDPAKPLPYPYHISPDGSVLRQDFWKGEPLKLLGFQMLRDRHQVDVWAEDWLARDDVDPAGMYPVFLDADGTMWNHTFPVEGGAL